MGLVSIECNRLSLCFARFDVCLCLIGDANIPKAECEVLKASPSEK